MSHYKGREYFSQATYSRLMPYRKHSDLKDPPNSTKIWRFTDFAKFYAMLSGDTLYFSRLDRLEDQFEGQFSEARVKFDEKVYDHPTMTDYGRSVMRWIHSPIRKNAFVNCWHINEYESGLLWSKYSVVTGGIAIQSTSDRLKKSFAPTSRAVYVSEIEYIDRAKQITPMGNVMIRAIQKGKSYQDERELRAMCYYVVNTPKVTGFGLYVRLEDLMESVYVSPKSSEWFRKLVERVLLEKGLKIPVKKSYFSQKFTKPKFLKERKEKRPNP